MRRLLFLLLFCCASAKAHQLSTGYLQANIDTNGVLQGQLQLRLYDLERYLNLDSDKDGKLRWRELQASRAQVENFIRQQLVFSREQASCNLAVDADWKVDEHFNEGYVVLPLRAQCGLAGDVEIHYQAFFADDSQHKLLVNFTAGELHESRVMSAEQPNIVLTAKTSGRLATAKEFIYQGMVHIWIGIDHILFLCVLLLPSVLIRRDHKWVARQDLRTILTNTFWLVTAFTLAHSIMLTATALNILQLPSRWVETAIALSVMLAALNNIFPLVLRLGLLTFGFGLLHGMGFAGALGELGIPADQRVLSVLAFNLGVEIGQVAILLVLLPVLILVRNYRWYSSFSVPTASLVITLVAGHWVIARAFY